MNALVPFPDTEKYAHAIKASKAVRWDIDRDVIRGRSFDLSRSTCPMDFLWFRTSRASRRAKSGW